MICSRTRRSDAGEARTRGSSVSSQAPYLSTGENCGERSGSEPLRSQQFHQCLGLDLVARGGTYTVLVELIFMGCNLLYFSVNLLDYFYVNFVVATVM